MKDRSSGRMNVMAAMVARVGRATLDAVMLGDRFAGLAIDAVGYRKFEPFKAGRIVRKLAVKVFLGCMAHFRFAVSYGLPTLQVNCTKYYLLSRDNYLCEGSFKLGQ